MTSQQRAMARAAGYGGLAASAAQCLRFVEAAQWYALAATWAVWAGDSLAAQDFQDSMRMCTRAAALP